MPMLWLRSLSSDTSTPIPGTNLVRIPFWSPDSRSIAFFADGSLKRVDLDGSSIRTLATSTRTRGGSWNDEGVILYSRGPTLGIWRVNASGGQPTQVTKVIAQQSYHLFPQFLPDGHHFIYFRAGSPEARGTYAGDLDGSVPRRLLPGDWVGPYMCRPAISFMAASRCCFAQRFDPVKLMLRGDPFTIATNIARGGYASRGLHIGRGPHRI